MLNKLSLAAAVAVTMLGVSVEAHAETYFNSPPITAGGACGINAVSAQIGLEQTGYFTGGRHYVRVAAQSGCGSNVAILWLSLPPGAVPSPTTADPIRCVRGRGNTQLAWIGECNPNPGFNAQMGRWYLGWSQLTMEQPTQNLPGEWVEIRVPVTYNQRLDIANSNARVSALVQNNFADLAPILGLSVTYRPQVTSITATNRGQGYGSQWGSWDGERFDLAGTLFNYFEGGTMTIEYGTTEAFGSTTGPISVPAGQLNQAFNVALTNLAQHTTYFWRVRFQGGGTVMTSPTQSFMTYAYLQFPSPAPKCRSFPCAF